MKRLYFLSVVAIIALCLTLFVSPISASATGNTYYFDAENGSDSNSGKEPNSPFKSVSVISKMQLTPGDTILFKRGVTYNTNGIKLNNAVGTEQNPITISCYGDENDDLPLIIGSSSVATAVVLISNSSYVKINSLHVTTVSTSTNNFSGIYIVATDGYRGFGNEIKNCIVEGASANWSAQTQKGFTGISVSHNDTYYGFIGSVTVENNQIYNCKALGICVDGAYGGCNSNGSINKNAATGVVIRNNYLSNIGKDGIFVNNSSGALVESNVCYKSHSFAKTTWHVAMWPFASYGALFQFNEAYATQTTYDGQGFDCDYQSYYSTFQYNYSHDNQGGFMLICTEPLTWDKKEAFNVGSTVRYNISQNDKKQTFCLTCHITDTKIYNNTIFNQEGDAENFINVFSRDNVKMPINTKFYNNIFYINSGKCVWEKAEGTEFKNNLYYGAKANILPQNDSSESSDDNITSENNIIGVDPLLADAGNAGVGIDNCVAYKLMENSPAINSGLVIGDEDNTRDYFGNSVSLTDKPNIGAYNGKGMKNVSGDIDFDENLTLKDTLLIKKYLAKIDLPNGILLKNADYNSDGVITLKDVLCVKKKLANID